MADARELYERGRAAGNSARWAEAEELLLQALSLVEYAELRALVEISLAYAEAYLGHVDQGMARLEGVLSRADLPDPVRGRAYSQRGLLWSITGDFPKAIEDLDRALPLIAGDIDLTGTALLNKGYFALMRGDVATATPALESAVDAFSADDHVLARAKAMHNLGYAHLLSGDLVDALHTMQRARELIEPVTGVAAAILAQDQAEVLIAAGLVSEGDAMLAAAATTYGRQRLPQLQGELELVRARTHLVRSPDLAHQIAGRAARRFHKIGSVAWADRAEAIRFTAKVAAGGQTPRLAQQSLAIAADLRSAGVEGEAVSVELSGIRVLIRRRELAAARSRLAAVGNSGDRPVAVRLLQHEVSAELARAEGSPSRALHHVRAGLAELHEWQSSFGSLDLQSGLAGHGRSLADQGMRIALGEGSPDLIFEWSERTRTLASRISPVRAPEDPALAAKLAELRFLQSQGPESESAQSRRLQTLRTEVRQQAWYGQGSREVTEPITMAQLQAELGADHAALVAYIGLDQTLTALVVSQSDARVVDLGSLADIVAVLDNVHADLDMAATDLPDPIREVVQASAFRALATLGEQLVAPIAELIGDRRLVITPSTAVARTPWTLLPGFEGRPLTVPQSATRWLTMHRSPSVTDPVVGFVAGPGVEWAQDELREARSTWGRGDLLTGPEATVAAATELAERADVLHFAAHGRHATDNAMFSGLELADGTFYGYDVDRIQRVPETVLLSACEVGRGTVVSGEETVGMTAAWLHAGAGSVIASCALIGDRAAEDVLVRVHRELAGGATPAAALATAQAESDALAPLICFGAGW